MPAPPAPASAPSSTASDDHYARRALRYGWVLAAMLPLLGLSLLWNEYGNIQARTLARSQLLTEAVEKQLRDRMHVVAGQLEDAARAARRSEDSAAAAHARGPSMRGVYLAADDQPPAADGSRPLSIGAPQRRDGRWALPVSRRTAGGVRVHGWVDAAIFADLVQGYSLSENDRIGLVHADSAIVARSNDIDRRVGERLDDWALFGPAWQGVAKGHFDERSPYDGVERRFVFRRLPDLSLVVVVATQQRSVLAAWAGFASIGFVLSLLLALLWVLLTRRLSQGQARQARLIGKLRETIRALNRTDERLRQAHTLAGMGEWEWNLDSGLVDWDQETWRIYGRTPGDAPLTLEDAFAAIDPRDRAGLQARAGALLEHADLPRNASPIDAEFRISRPDGSIRWLQTRAQPVIGSDGSRRIRGVQQDVTDLAEARERRDVAERQYRFLFEHNPLPMWVFDRETLRFLAVNEKAIAKYGYSREQFLALGVLDIRPEDEVAEARASIAAEPAAEDNERTWRHRLSDGRIIYVNNARVAIDFDGRRAWLVLIRDITEQVRAEAEREHSAQRFQLIARATSDAVFDLDLGHDALWWSDSFYSTFGYSREQIPGDLAVWRTLVHPDDVARVIERLREAIDSDRIEWEEEYRFRHSDGRFVEVVERGYLLRDADGRAIRMVGGMLDVSEKRRAEADLRLLRRAVEATNNGIIIADARQPDQPVVYVNPAFEEITGYAAEEILGRNCRLLQHGDRNQPAIEEIRQALHEQREVRVLLRNYRKDGALFYNDFQIAPVRDATGVLTHFVGVQSDVTDRQRSAEQLTWRATHDELTGLPNRQLLLERLQQAVLQAEREGTEVAVVFIDLDDFKLVNDSLGHSAGDEVLRAVARRLQDVVRGSETVGRFGGDEFVIVLTDRIIGNELEPVIERVCTVLSEPIEIAGVMYTLTPSIGHCRYPDSGSDAETLLMRADLAMYQAKQQGRNRAVGYRSEFDAAVSQRLQLVSQLRDALQRKEFGLAFQPLFGLDGKPTAVEALVRWQHPQRGLLMPDQFIGVCEESGLVVELGRRVLHEAARHHALLAAAGLGHLRIAVNVSAAQFAHDLHADVAAVVAQFALPPGILELELTESVIMVNPERAIHAMKRIAALGVGISVDDFGTGYSSLAYLKRLPIDRLKIDRSFVRDLGTDPDDAAICASIIGLAHTLGLSTVAEGVETVQQHQWLQARGCNEVQGYLLGRPQPFEPLLPTLAARARDRVEERTVEG
ncbi:EAL domain-containing protein [Lysobacter sp. D1-1-M9]|uniref:EAL domain-containing protein n=2 Tax=Novilysobacter TaxID=3382699 RepID=UPI002FC8965E